MVFIFRWASKIYRHLKEAAAYSCRCGLQDGEGVKSFQTATLSGSTSVVSTLSSREDPKFLAMLTYVQWLSVLASVKGAAISLFY